MTSKTSSMGMYKNWADRQNSTVIFSTFINGKEETNNNSVNGFSLMMNKNGEVWLEMGLEDYKAPKLPALGSIKGEDEIEIKEIYVIYPFYNKIDVNGSKWNRVGISIDKYGNVVANINGEEGGYALAENKSFGGNQEKELVIGNSYTTRKDYIQKIYLEKNKPGGGKEYILTKLRPVRYQLTEGFKGNIKSFRVSENIRDWVISAGK